MTLRLVDGTFELFRAFYGAPSSTAPDGTEVGATKSLLRALLALATEPHTEGIAVAFDTVIESFRNDLFDGYKTGDGIDPALAQQFPLAEQAARALGIVTWSMVEFEADDALASAAVRWAPQVDGVEIASPDKDLGQVVSGTHIVLRDRIRKTILDEDVIRARYGIAPASIPDWLALVGDTADGIPGLPRWGERSASLVLGTYPHLEDIPNDPAAWTVPVRGAATLAEILVRHRGEAELYRTLATLRTDVPLTESLDDLRWQGADRRALEAFADRIGDRRITSLVKRWRGE